MTPQTVEIIATMVNVLACPKEPELYKSICNKGKSIKEPIVPHINTQTDTYIKPKRFLFISDPNLIIYFRRSLEMGERVPITARPNIPPTANLVKIALEF